MKVTAGLVTAATMMLVDTSPRGGRSTWLSRMEASTRTPPRLSDGPMLEVALGRLSVGLEQAEAEARLLARLGRVEGVEGLLGRRGEALPVVVHRQP